MPQVEYPDRSRRDPRFAGTLDPEAVGHRLAAVGRGKRQGARNIDAADGHAVRVALGADRPAQCAAGQGGQPADVHPADWAAERAWLLLRMGEADAARLLIASVDTDRFTPKMNQVALQSALASSDPSAMCPLEAGLGKLEPRVAALVAAICASLSGESRTGRGRYRGGAAARPGRRDRPGAGRQGRRRGRRDVARGDDRMGAGRPAEQLALRPVDRDRHDAARAADQRVEPPDPGLAGARTDVLGDPAAALGAGRGSARRAFEPGADRPLCNVL